MCCICICILSVAPLQLLRDIFMTRIHLYFSKRQGPASPCHGYTSCTQPCSESKVSWQTAARQPWILQSVRIHATDGKKWASLRVAFSSNGWFVRAICNRFGHMIFLWNYSPPTHQAFLADSCMLLLLFVRLRAIHPLSSSKHKSQRNRPQKQWFRS